MYNLRSSRGGNRQNFTQKGKNFEQQKIQLLQQQPQQQQYQYPVPPAIPISVTEGQTQMEHQNYPQIKQCVTAPNNSPSTIIDRNLFEIDISSDLYAEMKPPITLEDNKNSLIKLETAQTIEEAKIAKTEVKGPQKRKTSKKELKKRLNARMRRLVCPKSPLVVFSELYKEVPIVIQSHLQTSGFILYEASIEIDGYVYTGEHISKTHAKQKACENFLRVMLAKKMNECSEMKEESVTETDIKSSENGSLVKSKGVPQEDFPWPQFASLAMHYLITQWNLQRTSIAFQEESRIKVAAKVSGMKKFPDKPENYNPVSLLHQMNPYSKFTEKVLFVNPPAFEISCEINGVLFSGKGTSKKAAKKECAIAAIKHIWNFDFHNIAVSKT